MSPLRIGIDWGNDHLSTANGQFRYAVDLLRGFSQLENRPRFVVFGTKESPPLELLDLFRERGGWVWSQKPLAGGRGGDFKNQWRSFLASRRHQIDLLHVIDGIIPFAPPCPVVATCYDLMMEVFPRDYADWLRSRGYRRTRWLSRRVVRRHLAISRTSARDLHRYWRIPASRIDVIYLGTRGFENTNGGKVDSLDDKLAPCVGHPVVASPFNLEPRKNLTALLTAIHLLRKREVPVRLVLFGRAAWTPEREERYREQVRTLGIEDSILRTGFLSDEELGELYRRACVFVFPSLYEGFGLPVLEAMRAGGCVVARDRSAMAEVVGEAGKLVETADPERLATAVTDLIADAAENQRLRDLAVRRSREFTVERMARQTYAAYLRALGVSAAEIPEGPAHH